MIAQILLFLFFLCEHRNSEIFTDLTRVETLRHFGKLIGLPNLIWRYTQLHVKSAELYPKSSMLVDFGI